MNKDQKIIFFIIIFPLTLYFGLRSLNHITNLFEAQKTVSETKQSINSLKDQNRLLRDALSFIESPDFLDQEAHEKFGLGTANDALLNLPQPSPDSKFDYFYPQKNNSSPPTNLSLWLNLFVY
jgi:cell division protein FtsB